MIFALALAGIGTFVAVFVRRFQVDIQQEEAFRRELNGSRFEGSLVKPS